MRKVCALLFSVSLSVFIFSCNNEPGNAKIEVWLTDAPGDYQEVNIEIIGVEVHSDEGGQAKGWKTLAVTPGVYDLLKLTNGLDTLIGTVELPAGNISQLRLKLGSENSVKIGDQFHGLSTPSAQQSGLKIQIHENLVEGITYKILLDFDVARSIVTQGNTSYSLKPVIRSITQAQDGAIAGIVTPAESTPAIYAIVDADTVGTTYADSAGLFLLRGLPAGTYKVSFSPNSDYQTKTQEGVAVSLGSITDLGTITIE